MLARVVQACVVTPVLLWSSYVPAALTVLVPQPGVHADVVSVATEQQLRLLLRGVAGQLVVAADGSTLCRYQDQDTS